MKRIGVLVVDDSALIRTLMTEIINAEADMHVVGTAPDPFVAREKIKELNPDVVTLDVELPRMNGLEFLERLMRLRPTPVVMVSSLTGAGAATTLRALELGAVDFVLKPNIDVKDGVLELAADITEKIRAAAVARVRRYAQARPAPAAVAQRVQVDRSPRPLLRSDETIIVIGASTGGTEALKDVLERIPRTSPPILVTQHMPPGFTKSFAERLDRVCQIDVCEAQHGMRLLSGNAYIAPGAMHLLVSKRGSVGYTHLSDGDPVNRHRPSVDVLFDSATQTYGRYTIAAILTGMGRDGAAGLKRLRDSEAFTVAQDEASCVVFGMPKAAIELGGATMVAPLSDIPDILMRRAGVYH
jgi:two-component system chemotaxis response regulator CheB